MIKTMSSFAAMAALVGGAYPFAAHSVTPRLIVPGKSVGRMSLGPNGRATLSRFGKPDAYDAGMSQTRQAWLGKGKDRATLYVHTVQNGALDAKPAQGLYHRRDQDLVPPVPDGVGRWGGFEPGTDPARLLPSTPLA